MLKYLIIPLDSTSVSFCHYESKKNGMNPIPLEMLKEGIIFGMKNNLQIQFIYPDYSISKEYSQIIESIDHVKIKPFSQRENADVIVVQDWKNIESIKEPCQIVIKTDKGQLFDNYKKIIQLIERDIKVNITINDIERFSPSDFNKYKTILDYFFKEFKRFIIERKMPQLNILTDRIILEEMNNCGAGDTSITLMPNGKFYICPAFYYETQENHVGSLKDGLNIHNGYLYKLQYAPICRHCEAYQCNRCIWLNHKTTLEVNTPSHEQCVISHIERNASMELAKWIKATLPTVKGIVEIPQIDYLDPITRHKEWQ